MQTVPLQCCSRCSLSLVLYFLQHGPNKLARKGPPDCSHTTRIAEPEKTLTWRQEISTCKSHSSLCPDETETIFRSRSTMIARFGCRTATTTRILDSMTTTGTTTPPATALAR